MKICVIGPGYVGLVTGACFAEMGNEVLCVGKKGVDDERIARLAQGESPIFETGLEELLKRNLEAGRLRFGLDLAEGVDSCLFQMIAVPTPSEEDGSADLQHVLEVAKDIGSTMEEYRIVVTKSTVPVGTADAVKSVVRQELQNRGKAVEFDVVSNPEFLKEGDAVQDFMKPDRVVVGCENPRTAELMKALYAPFARTREKLIIMDVRSAEMTKYAANSLLATKISFMNEVSKICEAVDADISMVRKGIGADPRIGYQFIYPGVGFGGSCFPKDLRALVRTAVNYGLQPRIMQSVIDVNEAQKRLLAGKVIDYFRDRGGLEGKRLAVWGLAFKPNTNDMREAPSITIIDQLLNCGADIRAFDPQAIEEAKAVFSGRQGIRFHKDSYEALDGAEALILITEWNMFRTPDFQRMKSLMKTPLIFDGRNQYDPDEMNRLGFSYVSIGRKPAYV